MSSEGELMVLILSSGMSFAELAAVIEELKNKSKSIGTHARRQLYWDAYTKMAGIKLSDVSARGAGARVYRSVT